MDRYDTCRGMTLIELMVSMVLGLVIVGGATSAILANRQSYRTNEALSQLQESQRTAFELLARDVREAGINGCNSQGKIANVLQVPGAGANWWQAWVGTQGFEGGQAGGAVSIGTDVAARVAGTDSLVVQGVQGVGVSVDTHQPSSANIKLNATTTAIVDNDILMICDFDHAAIFQVSNYNSNNVTLGHNTGNSMSPGNCSKGLGYPTVCTTGGNDYAFGRNSQIMRFSVVNWYVGNNGRTEEGGRSLYRVRMGSGASFVTEEVVAGISNMQLTYREQGRPDFRDSTAVGNWANVNAVRIELTSQSADQRVSSDTTVNSGRLQRVFASIVTLRNRVP